MPRLRKPLLGLALVTTIVASVLDLPEPPVVEQAAVGTSAPPVLVPAPSLVPKNAVVSTGRDEGSRERFTASPGNLFAVRSWLPPAPPPPKPQAPLAPPLPFKYLGKQVEGDEVLAFVGQGAMTHLLRKGSVIAGYKVEEVSQTDMTLVYLPLNEKQRLTFGSSN